MPVSPEVSIIVPTYKQGAYIGQCLQSLLSQSFTDFEVIIQDAFSPDETEEVCREVLQKDSRFQFFQERDRGQSDAINRGLQKLRGRYWTWICSDDYLADPEALASLVEALRQEGESRCVGVFAQADYVSEGGSRIAPYPVLGRDIERSDFLKDWPLCQPASLLKTEATRKVGGVDGTLNLGMDLDLFLRLLKESQYLKFLPIKAACVRIQPASKSVALRRKTAINAIQVLARNLPDYKLSFDSKFLAEIANSYLVRLPAFLYPLEPLRNRLLHRYWERLELGKTTWPYTIFFFLFRDRMALVYDRVLRGLLKMLAYVMIKLRILR
jgi:glycosyltransferase involved in cell wall biosynthesis